VVIAAGTGYWAYDKVQDQLAKNTPIAVADVGLLTQHLATEKLKAQGFQVKVATMSSTTVPAHEVARQDPAGGIKTAQGNPVTIWISTGPPMVSVPDVRKLNVTQAIADLAPLGLTANVHDVYSTEPPQSVTAQNPKPGTKVLRNSKIRLNVSQGLKQIGITSVVGQPYANAASALEGEGFAVVRTDQNSDQPKGAVISEDPQPGTTAPAGTKVTLTVSKGPVISQVPDVMGDTQQQAIQFLKQSGFTYSIVTQDVTDPSQDDLVLDQQPAGGTLKQGSSVTITIGHYTATTTQTTPTTTAATTTTATTTAATTTAPATTTATTTTTP
jgi:serine/threonine-protein kinase